MEVDGDNSCNGTKSWNRSPEIIITTSRYKSGGGRRYVHAPPQKYQRDDFELMTKTDDEIKEYIARQKKSYQELSEMLPDRRVKLLAAIRRHEIELERRKKLELEKETCEAEGDKLVQKRKWGTLRMQVKRPNGLQEGNSCCRSPDQHDEPIVAQNNAIMNTEYQQAWPFIKQSAIWATIESLESYWQPPQKPHFSPLKKVKADYREGLAISHMVTFDNLFDKISKLQLTDPVDIIKDSLETLVDLEMHGFDVGAVRARLNELLFWKVKVGELRDMAKKDEEEFEMCKEEMKQLEVRIKKLQTKMNLNVKQITDCEIAFEYHAATPF